MRRNFDGPDGLVTLMKKHKMVIPTALGDGFMWNHKIFGGSPHENYEVLLRLDWAAQGHSTLQPEPEPLTLEQKLNAKLAIQELDIKKLQTDLHNLTKLVHRRLHSANPED
jgi:hypothetical protein